MTTLAAFRSQFPVFERLSYLNAGTEGPVPRRAAEAAHSRIDLEVTHGRCGRAYFEALMELAARSRAGYAELLGADATQVALTGSTTDGVNTVLAGLDLRPGDEVLTSDEEHPGLLAPLGRARVRHGISVRVVPFRELANEVRPSTRLVACSHVSWVNGKIADMPALRAAGAPVLLDAAQALGAIPVDVGALGCDFYAASGQKWLCGPEGSGCLFVSAERLGELLVPWPGYGSVADPEHALEFEPAEGVQAARSWLPDRAAQRLGARRPGGAGGPRVGLGSRAGGVTRLAAGGAAGTARPRRCCDRDRSTLVSWRVEDAAGAVERLAAGGFVLRSIPGRELVRASVGAWSSEEELEQLATLAASR